MFKWTQLAPLSPYPFFFFFFCYLPLGHTVHAMGEAGGGYLKLWRCHLARGSTCAPEVLILILNRLDTKTNKLSSLHQTGLKNYGQREGYAITAANLRSPKDSPPPPPPPLPPHSQWPPATLDFKYRGAGSVCMCGHMCVWMGSE